MGFRLKTSKQTKDIFEELGSSINLKPFALSKLAIALSLQREENIQDFKSDTNGLELQRSTITGQYDTIYRCLVEENANKHLTDDEYFPEYTKKHIDRGAKLLIDKFKYSSGRNLEGLIKSLLKEGNGDL